VVVRLNGAYSASMNDDALRLVASALASEGGEHASHGFRMSVTGELDAATAPQLAAALQALIDDGATVIVLDAAHVEFVDSTGLRSIIHAGNQLADAGGRLLIEGMSGAVQRVLEVSGLIEHYRDGAV
jgi:anti-sigma B factor antagonist